MSHLSSRARYVLAVIAAALLATSVTACNTVEGAGQDMQSGGKAIERKANDAKN